MAILSILAYPFVSHPAPTETARPPGLGARLLAAIMASRAKEAERLVATMMARRGFYLVDGEWKDGRD